MAFVCDLLALDPANNIGQWASQTYLKGASNSYGLPSDGGVAVMVNGQSAYPIFNNQAAYTPLPTPFSTIKPRTHQEIARWTPATGTWDRCFQLPSVMYAVDYKSMIGG